MKCSNDIIGSAFNGDLSGSSVINATGTPWGERPIYPKRTHLISQFVENSDLKKATTGEEVLNIYI
jgi:hypothetical protein